MGRRFLNNLEVAFLPLGRLLKGSKSQYIRKHPYHPVIFNANILVKEKDSKLEKIWHGDLDLHKDFDIIKDLAKNFLELYILREVDARFYNEKNPQIQNFVIKFCEGQEYLSPEITKAQGRIFRNCTEMEFSQEELFHSINVDKLYQNKKFEQVKIPEDILNNFTQSKLKNLLYKYALENFEKIAKGEIGFYHQEMKSYFVKDFLKRSGASVETTEDIVRIIKGESNPLFLIKFLYTNRQIPRYESLLKSCLNFDFMYLATNKKTSKQIYSNSLNRYFEEKTFETSDEDLIKLQSVVNKGCPAITELISLFSESNFGKQIKDPKDRAKLQRIHSQAQREAYALALDGVNTQDLVVISQIRNYIMNGAGSIISWSHASECPEGFMWIPWSKGLIF